MNSWLAAARSASARLGSSHLHEYAAGLFHATVRSLSALLIDHTQLHRYSGAVIATIAANESHSTAQLTAQIVATGLEPNAVRTAAMSPALPVLEVAESRTIAPEAAEVQRRERK